MLDPKEFASTPTTTQLQKKLAELEERLNMAERRRRLSIQYDRSAKMEKENIEAWAAMGERLDKLEEKLDRISTEGVLGLQAQLVEENQELTERIDKMEKRVGSNQVHHHYMETAKRTGKPSWA